VRLWQDLDADGVSDPNELSRLADKGIAIRAWSDLHV
jgi:hypothetical protein